MPKIRAETIEKHVARQERAVIAAATELFAERGFSAVTMADIAERVGLARNSLYRYFPDKERILLTWLRRETESLLQRLGEVVDSGLEPRKRLARWLRAVLEYVDEPDHRLFVQIASTMGALSPEAVAEVAAQHRQLYASAEPIVKEALQYGASTTSRRRGGRSKSAARDPKLVTAMIAGLLRAASEAVASGEPFDRVADELERSATAVVTAAKQRHGVRPSLTRPRRG